MDFRTGRPATLFSESDRLRRSTLSSSPDFVLIYNFMRTVPINLRLILNLKHRLTRKHL